MTKSFICQLNSLYNYLIKKNKKKKKRDFMRIIAKSSGEFVGRSVSVVCMALPTHQSNTIYGPRDSTTLLRLIKALVGTISSLN